MVSVDGGRLRVQRLRGDAVLGTTTTELGRVLAVDAGGDHVGLELDDGTRVELGKGLRVPRGARRWVARRIAGCLPAPGARSRPPSRTDGSTA